MAQRSINVAGRNVTLLEDGSGDPLVYLHGYADVHGVDAAFLPFHQSLASKRHLMAPAHPGCNGSTELTGGHSPEDYVFHYLELFDALGLTRFDLVGHCIGGWLAAEIAVRHPEKVKSLGLIGASGLFISGQHIGDIFMHSQPERGVDYTTLRHMLFSSSHAELALRYYPDGRGNIDEEVRRYEMLRFGSFVGFKPPYFYNRSLIDRLHRAKMPSLVVWGALDHMTPLAHGNAYAAGLPGSADALVLPGAGHAAHLEAPEAAANAFAGFLQ